MRYRWLFSALSLLFMGYILPDVFSLLTHLVMQPGPVQFLALLIFPAYIITAATLVNNMITSWLEIE